MLCLLQNLIPCKVFYWVACAPYSLEEECVAKYPVCVTTITDPVGLNLLPLPSVSRLRMCTFKSFHKTLQEMETNVNLENCRKANA